MWPDLPPHRPSAPQSSRALVWIPCTRDMRVNRISPPLAPGRVAGLRPSRQGRREEGSTLVEGVDPGGRPYLWLGNFQSDVGLDRGTDLAAVMEGAIAVTPLHMDLTHKSTLKKLSGLFG